MLVIHKLGDHLVLEIPEISSHFPDESCDEGQTLALWFQHRSFGGQIQPPHSRRRQLASSLNHSETFLVKTAKLRLLSGCLGVGLDQLLIAFSQCCELFALRLQGLLQLRYLLAITLGLPLQSLGGLLLLVKNVLDIFDGLDGLFLLGFPELDVLIPGLEPFTVAVFCLL